MNTKTKTNYKGMLIVAFCICALLSLPAAWLTHLVVCFSDEKWGFLIAGAILFPIAIVHGFGIWLGAW